MSDIEHDFDIVIAGGGLSGSLTALSLANLSPKKSHNDKAKPIKPLSIAIIEASSAVSEHNNPQNPSTTATNFDERVLALSHGTANFLAEQGVWQYLKADANPIETIHISDRGYYGKARIYAKDHNVEALGYVAEMRAIGASLHKALAAHNNITWFSGKNTDDIEWAREKVTVCLADSENTSQNTSQSPAENIKAPDKITAKLLLACDGANSKCRNLANISITEQAYQQAAVIANVRTEKSHNNLAYERFTEFGPIAMLPLTDNRCSLVWTVPESEAENYKNLSDQKFIAKLNQAFGFWFGEITEVSKRVVFPLKLVQAQENAYHRMALVGNSSHTIHPIAGQGFNLGVRDVQAITEQIAKALVCGQDIGDFQLLNQYGQARQQDQQAIINLTDSLVTLFSNDLPPLVAGRNIGLKVLNYLPQLKNSFVNKTMGY